MIDTLANLCSPMPQPKSRLPELTLCFNLPLTGMEREMAPYFLNHLWHQQDKKLASVSTTSWQRAAGTWDKLISGSLSVKGEREGETDSYLGMGLSSWEFIMEVPGFRTQDERSPRHPLGVSHKEGTEARLRETLTAVCETRQYCSAEQSSSGFPLYPVFSQTPGRKQEVKWAS